MKKVNRRRALTAGGTALAGSLVLNGTAADKDPAAPKRWTLEGVLKVHPKNLYRYFLVLGNGQVCALYGSDHGRESDQLSKISLPAFIRVRGALGTEHHSGGTNENPSPFPDSWLLYMDIHDAEKLGAA